MLALYVALVHKTNKGAAAIPPAHILRIIEVLEDDSLGHTLIVAPPGSAKTNTLIAAAGHWFGEDPTQHIAFASAEESLAFERSVAVRDTITHNENYRAIFPDVLPDRMKGWGEKEWFLQRPDVGDKDPSLIAIGMNSNIVGRRLNRAIIDDPGDEKNMQSAATRDHVRRKISQAIMGRMLPGGRAVMITTRWHDEDAAAWAMSQGWHVVHIKAIDEEGGSYWPEMWPIEKLRCPNGCPTEGQCYFDKDEQQWTNCKYRELGSQGFAQQYQGEAYDDASGIYRRGWFNRRYKLVPPSANRGTITCDTAGWDEKSTTSDYCAIGVYRTDGQQLYKLHMLNERMSFPEVERALADMQAHYKLPIVVEDVPWARPLIQRLQLPKDRGGPGCWGVIAQKTEGRSKINRAKAVSPIVEAGNLLLPEDADWVGDFIEAMVGFPNAANDDIVDEFEIAARYLLGNARRKEKQTFAGGRVLRRG